MRKPVFRVCDQLRLKLACSADEASKDLEILPTVSKDIILSRQRTANNKGTDQTARMHRLICGFVVHIWQKTGFLMTWLIWCKSWGVVVGDWKVKR